MQDKPKGQEIEVEPVERLAYSIPEAAKSLGVSRSKFEYMLALPNGPRSVKDGRRVLIPKQELIAFLERGMR
tara:strand:- start:44 stop:259 length:216 start_codon:yes stop_codon:yes gene_type:complete